MAKKLPEFDALKKFYRGDGWMAEYIKKTIGGAVDSPDIDDTCIVRLSEPLNKAGHPIPAWTKPFRTRQGTDKRWYGLRVAEFWPYMVKTYGKPTIHKMAPLKRGDFEGPQGIIGFRVPFKGATGHFTLWDGQALLYGGNDHDYFNIATEAALWQAGSSVVVRAPI
jgi:hypothetical protein